MVTTERLETLRGVTVYDTDGDKIGSVEEVFVDGQTKEPEWIGLGTGIFGTKRVLVPAANAEIAYDRVVVPYSKDRVKDTPDIDSDRISQETEAQLYAHYGLDYTERESDTGLPEGGPSAGPEDEAILSGGQDIVRSEEELRVGKREVEAGRLRVHKWVESEQVVVPVEVEREKARVTREPVDPKTTPSEIGEESIEVILREEQPVVEKQTVAKERIGIDTEVESETQTVGDEVRKERVEVDDQETPRQ